MNQQTKNILIVDDIQENLQVLGNILQEKNFDIRVARNGEQALLGISKKTPDLILLDISMPGMNGYEVCRQLKSQEETRHIPVIFLTARTEKEDIVAGFKAGGVDYITKPFHAEELISRVHTHIELKNAREELRQLNASKDKLFGIIGHDLKGPLSQVIQLSEIIEKNFSNLEEDRIREFLSNMKETSLNSIKLLENLLDWARTQTDSYIYSPQNISVSGLIAENIQMLSRQASSKNIDIAFNGSDFGEIWADENMINTVLRNLISNAIKFTHPGGKIRIESKKENGDFVVSVIDNGIGMTKEKCHELFKTDYVSSTNGTNNEKGTGLGLIICKEFIEKHKGSIWVESSIDKGSVFSFSIPEP